MPRYAKQLHKVVQLSSAHGTVGSSVTTLQGQRLLLVELTSPLGQRVSDAALPGSWWKNWSQLCCAELQHFKTFKASRCLKMLQGHTCRSLRFVYLWDNRHLPRLCRQAKAKAPSNRPRALHDKLSGHWRYFQGAAAAAQKSKHQTRRGHRHKPTARKARGNFMVKCPMEVSNGFSLLPCKINWNELKAFTFQELPSKCGTSVPPNATSGHEDFIRKCGLTVVITL